MKRLLPVLLDLFLIPLDQWGAFNLDGPPTQLSDLVPLNEKIKKHHPGVTTILWDYKSPYNLWGILASAAATFLRRTAQTTT
jgi:hypothetical protein